MLTSALHTFCPDKAGTARQVIFVPAGLFLCFRRLGDEHVFAILYGVLAAYFSGIMVRLMLTLTPIACVLGALSVSTVLDTYLRNGPVLEAAGTRSKSERKVLSMDIRVLALVPLINVLLVYPLHCTMVTSSAYSSPSIVLASRRADGSNYIIDDFREAYFWLRQNTPEDSKVMSWWDYGYQLTGMANRTVLVDNNTWNNTHIATVGKVRVASPRPRARAAVVASRADRNRELNARLRTVMGGADGDRPCPAARRYRTRSCASSTWTTSW